MASIEEELSGPPWVYPWRLRDGRTLPVSDPELPSVHATRSDLLETPVREALARAGSTATALDLACNEGWFSHQLLEWGAARVVGIDVRERNIRRAALLREHFGIRAEQFELHQDDVFDLDAATLGQFDVVLVLGLIYHVENPMGVLRLAARCTRQVCVIESQLTRQTRPVEHGWGRSNEVLEAEGSFAAVVETADTALSSTMGVISLVPNRVALAQMVRAAGFDRIEFASPDAHHNTQYVGGDRAILFAYP